MRDLTETQHTAMLIISLKQLKANNSKAANNKKNTGKKTFQMGGVRR